MVRLIKIGGLIRMNEKELKKLKKDIRTFVRLHTWEFNVKTVKMVRKSQNRLSTFSQERKGIKHYPPTREEIKDYCE